MKRLLGYDLVLAQRLGRTEQPQAEILKDFPDAREFSVNTLANNCWFFETDGKRDAMPPYFVPDHPAS